MTDQPVSHLLLSADDFTSQNLKRILISSYPQCYERWYARKTQKISKYEEISECPTLNGQHCSPFSPCKYSFPAVPLLKRTIHYVVIKWPDAHEAKKPMTVSESGNAGK